ncbi:MAG: hypothetical protein ACK56I_04780, partial [bacterium]
VVELRVVGGRDVRVELDAVDEQARLVGGRAVEELHPDEAPGDDRIAREDVGRRELPVHAVRAVRQLLDSDPVGVARGRAVAEGLHVRTDGEGRVVERPATAGGAGRARARGRRRVHVGGHEPVLGIRLGGIGARVGTDDPLIAREVRGVARGHHHVVHAPCIRAVDVHRPNPALVRRGPDH